MFVANFIVLFTNDPPAVISHAKPGTVLPLDLVAPFFGFAMGLSIPFFRDKFDSLEELTKRLLLRVILLYVIGKVPNLIYRFIFFEENIIEAFIISWSILETWAFGLIIGFLLYSFNFKLQIIFSLTLLLIYQFILLSIPAVSSYVNRAAEGGMAAVLSWVFVISLGTIIGEIIRDLEKSKLIKTGLTLSLSLVVASLILHYGDVLVMERLSVSASYILFSSGVAVFVFYIFYFLNPLWGVFFRNIGMYPLQAWVLQSIFYVPVYLTVGGAYFAWPVGGLIALGAVIFLMSVDEILISVGVKIKA